MSIHVALSHFTSYDFDRPVAVAPHVLRLRPAPHCRTPILSYSLRVEPEPHFINWQQDPYGNYLARLVFPEKMSRLTFEVGVVADLTIINPFDFFLEESAQRFPFTYGDELAFELAPYLDIRERGPLLMKWLDSVDRQAVPTVDFLVALNRRLHGDLGYVIRLEPGVQTCEETLGLARGSCRDSAWLLVQILRHLGLAARFVSGYLVQLTADIASLDGPSGPTSDFTDLHAWAEVYVPGAGWVGLDPTSGLCAGEGHIPLACTSEPSAAAPITGATDPCEVKFHYTNAVRRVREDPRVTLPYSDQQWSAIDALGESIDAVLARDDVRLTLGGEPTFVSIDDMDGAEWNTAALGANKRTLATRLLRALWRRFGPEGVIHHGQGKWYPGEELPRWALGSFWRRDGHALWRDPELLAREDDVTAYGLDEARAFISLLAESLVYSDRFVIPGFEDVLYHLWKEQTLPPNVDPLRANVDDPEERKRLAFLLTRGLSTLTGFALPLRWLGQGAWTSHSWEFRRGRMELLPGSSPMGYRLPLDSLAWCPPEQRHYDPARAPFDTTPALPIPQRQRPSGVRPGAAPGEFSVEGSSSPSATALTRAAVCVEPRDGHLYVFLPPLPQLEAYVDLIAAIEATAAALSLPVVLEGYEPPRDPRLLRLLITPDPGVIEVNIHPAASWRELSHNTLTLYEEARLCRLGTEKFMLDGRHTGTAGGNHITIGGATPGDSPALRRPDLLQSLVTYWQHHPSLSFLFSGLFVGPTSQAPRVDEARNDSLYELEIAFQQVPPGFVPQAWLVDRLFRDLLVDATGNTHRSEFCIDKLYSPDGAAGRLGLIEMRAFEMPPHARMSLVQQLLVRGLIARFWQAPYRADLVRWDTALHDRFMLPHFLWEDLREVVDELSRAGFPFELSWFAPFLEFRFPRHGTINVGDLQLELRPAIEPWHVLGEEVSSQGTARYVDSSVERVQVKALGFTPGRYAVTCNGRRVPLRPTGRRGEEVAGVRYRAWQPSSALHPTIPVHTPLIFDIVDTWNQCSIGGCTYHVAHPGGRTYSTFPVNANEAEARRVARFWPWGHTPGTIVAPAEEQSREFPLLLDLRRGALV